MEVLSIIGSIASIIGAIWALNEGRKAKGFCEQAQQIKNDLIEHRHIAELSKMQSEAIQTLKTVSQIGPTCTQTNIVGINTNNVAKKLQDFSLFLKEHKSTGNLDRKINKLCSSLKPVIELLAIEKDFEKIKENGKEAYYLIEAFLPELKNKVDTTKE